MNLRAALAVATVLSWTLPAHAFPLPGKPIHLVVPFPAGGEALDGTARLVAQKLAESIGVAVIVDNRPGAGGVIGNRVVASAAPDGHTLLYGAIGSLTLLPHQLSRRPYNELRDFTPITSVARSPLFLMAHPSVPARNVDELVAYARANPGRLSFASWQFGGFNHLYPEMLKVQAGIEMVHIPYKGPDEALKDLLEGRVELMMGAAQNHVAFVRMGKLNALAATGTTRMRGLADLPTFGEQGYSGYEHVGSLAILGPGKMAPALVGRLNAEFSRILTLPEVIEFFVRAVPTFEVAPSSPEALAAQLRGQYEAMGPVIRKLGISID